MKLIEQIKLMIVRNTGESEGGGNERRLGQVTLVILVISAVVMTIGLSMSKKAVVETRIDTDDETLKQAFNAAESGVDYYLGTGEVNYSSPDGMTAEVTVNTIGGENELNLDEFTGENKVALFWLVGHDSDGNIDYSQYYGEGSDLSGDNLEICVSNDFDGSLKVEYFYLDDGDYKVSRKGFNYSLGQTVSGFDDKSGATSDSCGSGRKEVDVADFTGDDTTPLLLTATPIFAGTKLSLRGSGTFPAQGEEIVAVGRAVDETMGGVNQRVRVFERYKIPAFMLEAMTARLSVLSN